MIGKCGKGNNDPEAFAIHYFIRAIRVELFGEK